MHYNFKSHKVHGNLIQNQRIKLTVENIIISKNFLISASFDVNDINFNFGISFRCHVVT
jgi:hypothetical protein